MATKAVCPVHRVLLESEETVYGLRWQCPVDGCTVALWNGSTSTPADQKTRDARRTAHEAFDVLWRGPGAPFTRSGAYRWLRGELGLTREECHIGMFDFEQCRQVCLRVAALRRRKQVRDRRVRQ